MQRFVGAVRVLIGFALACLAAGFVQVLFAVTPAELVAAGDERLVEAGNWGLLSATQIAVFSAPFALIAVLISEWQGIRSFAFHAMVAMAIAVAGFGLIHATESATEASIVNSYAMAAYLTSGFVAGFVYWLFSGRLAYRAPGTVRMESDRQLASETWLERRRTRLAEMRAAKSRTAAETEKAKSQSGKHDVSSATAHKSGSLTPAIAKPVQDKPTQTTPVEPKTTAAPGSSGSSGTTA